ncbi:Bgt-20430 [Blumeria graminis f. sp. tritici]|uniref:Bgt-20430 n=2 Tax=Blumeria graminis f. sp. tritici TaxID=62690 RepID=A0A9X9L7W7_BLUGR|nr:Bgt-20430 [Blumeria graminis f. sp. tritici]
MLDAALFCRLLSISLGGLCTLPSPITENSLDSFAKDLVEAIWMAYASAARRSLGHGKSNPWWNKSCKCARQIFKSAIKTPLTVEELKEARKTYRKTIKMAKNIFYIGKLVQARISLPYLNGTSPQLYIAQLLFKTLGFLKILQ